MFAQRGSSSNTSETGQRPEQAQLAAFEVPRESNVYGTARGPVASAFGRASDRRENPERRNLRMRARASSSGASRPKTTPSGPALRSPDGCASEGP